MILRIQIQDTNFTFLGVIGYILNTMWSYMYDIIISDYWTKTVICCFNADIHVSYKPVCHEINKNETSKLVRNIS